MSPAASPTRWAVMILVTLLATLLVPLVTETLAMRMRPELGASRFDTVRGEQIFKTRCAVCHASSEGDLSRLGPSLRNLGGEAASRKPGLNGPQYILESILEPGAFLAPGANAALMPQNLVADLSPADIRHLVAYLMSLRGQPRDAQIQALVIEHASDSAGSVLEIRREVIELGERVYREKCHGCHGMHNLTEYTVHAPIVFGVGVPEGAALRDAILHRRRPVSERYRTLRVELESGAILQGNVLQRSPEGFLLVSTAPEDRGRLTRVELTDVRAGPDGQPRIEALGLPPELAVVVDSLTPAEIEALAVLLEALN